MNMKQKSLIFLPVLLVVAGFNLSACDDSGKNDRKNAPLAFIEVTEKAGLSYTTGDDPHVLLDRESGGVAVDDFNKDGFVDLFIAHGTNAAAKLFLNDGDGTFTDISAESGVVTSHQARGGLFIDITGDGINDLLVSEVHPENLAAYKNNGDLTFSKIPDAMGLKPGGATFSLAGGDYDRDGDIDIAVAQYHEREVEGSFDGWLWEKQEGVYLDVTDPLLPIPPHKHPESPGGITTKFQWNYTPSFSDFDNNGFSDLLMVANFENSNIYNYNDTTGFSLLETDVFTDEAGMGLAIGDYDNDGDLDWFVTSIWHPDPNFKASGFDGRSGNRMYKNLGNGQFEDATEASGVRIGYFGWGACFGDFDNDGDLDLFHVNGYGDYESLYGQEYLYFIDDPAVFFLNNGDGTFTEQASNLGIRHLGQGRGLSCLDYDKDGDLDILIANLGEAPNLYKNTLGTKNNFLSISLKGLPGNSQGVGSKIFLEIDDKKLLREIRLGSNFLSNNPLNAHFGLASATKVDKLIVEWNDPNASTSVLHDVKTNQYIEILHPDL